MTRSNTAVKETLTISELANELEISPPTIRYYEEKGLITPDRTRGNQRVYLKKHRARLKIILRGKRFGFTLDEIAEMIGMEEMNMDEVEQIHRSRRFLDRKVEEIRVRRTELDFVEQDLLTFKKKLAKRERELSFYMASKFWIAPVHKSRKRH
ncbi:MAG: MerR family transcriptional regulator [Deltaproteobacteria bacterium]|nr:MerR family transcriptional regulator [Deltaproteobacteria bacterium]